MSGIGLHRVGLRSMVIVAVGIVGCGGGEVNDPLLSTEGEKPAADSLVTPGVVPTSNAGDVGSGAGTNRPDNSALASSSPSRDSEDDAERESVEIKPYKGPPVFLPDAGEPLPATIVEERRTVTQKYPDGSPQIERQVTRYSDERLVNDGAYREYFPNGQIFVEGAYEKGDQQGQWTYWHDNGQKNRTVNYTNGVPDGSWEVYRRDGSLEAKRSFVNGSRNGEWTVYDTNGNDPLRIMNFKDGKRHGEWKEWFAPGLQKNESNFVDGLREGPATEWDAEGNKRALANYKGGKLHGEVIRWSVDGKEFKQEYDNGRLVGESNK